MTSLAFIFGVLPLAIASGAGSGAQNALGSQRDWRYDGVAMCWRCCFPLFYVLIGKVFVPGQSQLTANTKDSSRNTAGNGAAGFGVVMTILKAKKHQDPIQAEARRQQVLRLRPIVSSPWLPWRWHGRNFQNRRHESRDIFIIILPVKKPLLRRLSLRTWRECSLMEKRFSAKAESQVVDAMVESAAHGIDKNLAPAYAALQLEMLSEAARNDKVAALLRHVDASARSQLSALLTGEQGSMQHLAAEEVTARIELLCAVFNGFLVRAVLHPKLDQSAVMHILQTLAQTITSRPIAQPAAQANR